MELWKGRLTGFAKGWVKVFSVAVALFSVLTLHAERYCPCDMPEPVIGADFVIRCTVCKNEIKICIHHDSLPDALPLARCPECGGWWRDNANSSAQGTVTLCGCAMPSPARRDGSIRCTVCSGVIRSCRHHSAHPPSRYPLTRCSDCKGWWNDNGCCRCAQPEMTRQNGRLMCGRCRYWIRLCSCPDGKRPQIGGENEKCPVCGGWREKAPESGDETDTADDTPESGDETGPKDDPPGNKPSEYVPTPKKKPQPPEGNHRPPTENGFPLWDEFLKWLYSLADWFYFFKYFFTSYHLECANPANMSPREFYINAVDSMFKGTYPAGDEREYDMVRNLHLWSFLGMRLCFFVGNTVGSDGRNDYCPVALRYPFFGAKELCVFPKDPGAMRAGLRAASKNLMAQTYEWDQELTYFPEPDDDFSHAAEAFAARFQQAVHAGKDDAVKKMSRPGSSVAGTSVDALRRILPAAAMPGRASRPLQDIRMVPFLILKGNRAHAVRLLIEHRDGKLYVCGIL